MKTVGNMQFPENMHEAVVWQPYERRVALDRQVLVLARSRQEGAWKAYCGAVLGMDHDMEVDKVRREGTQLPEIVARALFPEFEGVPYAK